jgi:GntR family transcriptional regulator/MocR family aminotransferase
LSDVAISERARDEGIIVNALSVQAVQGESAWQGLMLGYAQVPPAQMEGLVKRLAAVIHLFAYAARKQNER